MDNSPYLPGTVVHHDGDEVSVGVPAVDDHGLSQGPGQLQLVRKDLLLDLSGGEVPVVVQAHLSQGHYLFMAGHLLQEVQVILGDPAGTVGVKSYGAENVGLPLGQLQGGLAVFPVYAHGDHEGHSFPAGPLYHRLAVLFIVVHVEMAVGIYEFPFHPLCHLTGVPTGVSWGTSRTFIPWSHAAARIMPRDSIPMSLAGFRLATITTFLPTSSWGW